MTNSGFCIICEKPIDDHGFLFCSKCREKDWKIRFRAIQKKEKEKWGNWKGKGNPGPPKQTNQNFYKKETTDLYIKDYWKRRRHEYG